MADPIIKTANLRKELTRLGDINQRLHEILFYTSKRTVNQYKKMRMYPVCWLGINFIKLGLPNVPFNVECDESEEIKEVVNKAFSKIWRNMIKDGLEMLDYGFKTLEVLYDVGSITYKDENDESITVDNKIILKQPRGLDGETIEILVDDTNGELKGFRQDYEQPRTVLVKDRKSLVFTNNLESGNYWGISALEPIYPFWYDAIINRQLGMRFLERKGTGLFVGHYPPGTTETTGGDKDNQDIMQELLNGIMEGTTITLPTDMDENGNQKWSVDVLEPGDRTDSFIAKANYIDEKILHGLVIPEKALTQGEIGSRASVETFKNSFLERKQEVLNTMVDQINRSILKYFVELNFGPNIDCKIIPGRLDDSSKELANNIAEKLIERGSLTPEKKWIMEKTAIPFEDKEEQEPILPEDENNNEDRQQIEEDNKPDKNNEIITEPKKDKEKKEDLAEFTPFRKLTKREESFNLNEFNRSFDELQDEFKNNMKTEIDRQMTRIKGYLSKNLDKLSGTQLVNGIQLNRNPIKKIIKEFLNTAYSSSFVNFKNTVEGIELAEIKGTEFMALRSDLTSDKVVDDLLKAIMFSVASDVANQLSFPEISGNLEEIIDSFKLNNLDKISDTEAGYALSQANRDYLRINKQLIKQKKLAEEKAVKRFEYSAIMDRRVCPLCRALDGTVVREDSPIYHKNQTPRHYLCRCVWLPITQLEIDEPRFDSARKAGNVKFPNGQTKYDATGLSLNENGRPLTATDINGMLAQKITPRSNRTLADLATFGEHYE